VARSGFSSKLVTTTVDSRAVLKALNGLPKEVQAEIRAKNLIESQALAREIIMAAYDPRVPPQAELVAKSVKGARDRTVKVNVGGNKKVGRPYRKRTGEGEDGKPTYKTFRASAGYLMYGAEHGSSGEPKDRSGRTMGNRFVRPHRGNPRNPFDGYWIGPVIAVQGQEIADRWRKLCQRAIDGLGLD
jgi:hypothetical protein